MQNDLLNFGIKILLNNTKKKKKFQKDEFYKKLNNFFRFRIRILKGNKDIKFKLFSVEFNQNV